MVIERNCKLRLTHGFQNQVIHDARKGGIGGGCLIGEDRVNHGQCVILATNRSESTEACRTPTIAGPDDGWPCPIGLPSIMVHAAISPTKDLMRNPLMTKNPFMSAWLSSANKVMGSARGQATAAARRQATSIQTEATKQVTEFWLGKPAAPARRTKKR